MKTPTLAEDRKTLLTADGAGKTAKAAALARLEKHARAAGVSALRSQFRRSCRLVRRPSLNPEAAK